MAETNHNEFFKKRLRENLLLELDKKTLKSYIDKATPDVGTYKRASQSAFARANKQWDVRKNVEIALRAQAKSKRRAEGIELATKLLKKRANRQ